MILFIDIETTGLPRHGRPIAEQPHLLQFAALLVGEGDGVERATVRMLVRPDGWTVPEEATAINGIDTALATAAGLPLAVVLATYTNLRSICTRVAAHNVSFDASQMKLEIDRMRVQPSHPGPATKDYICTMKMAAPVVNLPPTDRMLARGMTGPKSPKLEEAYRFLFGEEIHGAHDALVDVRACARIYYEILRRREEGRAAALMGDTATLINDEVPF